jgi:hypothetical protein
MNSKLIKILGATCLFLMVILLLEWAYSEYSEKQLLDVLESMGEQNYLESELPEIKLAEVAIEEYTALIERPLFIAGRKPVVEGESTDLNALDTGKIEDWVLVGIYSKGDQLIALFKSMDKAAKYLKKNQGDDISGWLLKEILADRVIVERLGKKQNIMLRKPKPVTKLKTRIKPKLARSSKKKITPKK